MIRSHASDLLKGMSGIQVWRSLLAYVLAEHELIFPTEIFLPSYVDCDFESLERKRDPVHEIRLSDEEIKQMFPQ